MHQYYPYEIHHRQSLIYLSPTITLRRLSYLFFTLDFTDLNVGMSSVSVPQVFLHLLPYFTGASGARSLLETNFSSECNWIPCLIAFICSKYDKLQHSKPTYISPYALSLQIKHLSPKPKFHPKLLLAHELISIFVGHFSKVLCSIHIEKTKDFYSKHNFCKIHTLHHP